MPSNARDGPEPTARALRWRGSWRPSGSAGRRAAPEFAGEAPALVLGAAGSAGRKALPARAPGLSRTEETVPAVPIRSAARVHPTTWLTDAILASAVPQTVIRGGTGTPFLAPGIERPASSEVTTRQGDAIQRPVAAVAHPAVPRTDAPDTSQTGLASLAEVTVAALRGPRHARAVDARKAGSTVVCAATRSSRAGARAAAIDIQAADEVSRARRRGAAGLALFQRTSTRPRIFPRTIESIVAVGLGRAFDALAAIALCAGPAADPAAAPIRPASEPARAGPILHTGASVGHRTRLSAAPEPGFGRTAHVADWASLVGRFARAAIDRIQASLARTGDRLAARRVVGAMADQARLAVGRSLPEVPRQARAGLSPVLLREADPGIHDPATPSSSGGNGLAVRILRARSGFRAGNRAILGALPA
ncbi:hypothetical protein AKJ08_2650 [Vulgatibacter incomptus]|uniref:Uncharacterized protein n=1 Tax=Vulgatibacter incomptus TaxID=1391653 RepID=A0A0K1PFF7_9BACT|nr:hypothetical protein AKJ08_2650 [Vulgatibacter incomptus]